MKRTAVLAVVTVLLASAAVASPVLAQDDGISLEVSVDGEEYDDGERVEIDADELIANVSIESENELNVVETTVHTQSIIAGVTGNSYNTSHVIETRIGPNEYTVRVEDVDGNMARHTVNFYKEATTPRELQQVVDRLEQRRERIEDDIESLRDRRDELNETQQDLRQRLNETESNGGGDGNGADNGGGDEQEPQGLPGFGVVVTLVAAGLVGAGVGRR